MDPTIIAALIAAAAAIAAALIGVRKGRQKKHSDRRPSPHETDDRPPRDGKLPTKLIIVLGDGHLGPIELGLYADHKPKAMTSKTMDDPLELPQSMRTESRRRLYWQEGKRFLVENKGYWAQGVRPHDTLVLTDQANTDLVGLIADTVTSTGDRKG